MKFIFLILLALSCKCFAETKYYTVYLLPTTDKGVELAWERVYCTKSWWKENQKKVKQQVLQLYKKDGAAKVTSGRILGGKYGILFAEKISKGSKSGTIDYKLFSFFKTSADREKQRVDFLTDYKGKLIPERYVADLPEHPSHVLSKSKKKYIATWE